jgi:hypothetical protein
VRLQIHALVANSFYGARLMRARQSLASWSALLVALAGLSPARADSANPFAAHLSASAIAAAPAPAPSHAYPLDAVSRSVTASGALHCSERRLVRYTGSLIPFERPARVDVAFRTNLRRFESIVSEVAIRSYHRAPSRIRHLGTFSCRRIRGLPMWLSEHGLGNAIDVSGFDFDPASDPSRDLPRSLHGAFQVTLREHWRATDRIGMLHRNFLRTLAARLAARPDIFRVLLGPDAPGHKNHFHFDMGQVPLVDL